MPPSTTRRSLAPEVPALLGVEAAPGLVEAHDARAAGQRPRDADELALALRELVRPAVPERLDPELRERRVDGLVRRRPTRTWRDGRRPDGPRPRREVLAHGQVVEEVGACHVRPRPRAPGGAAPAPMTSRPSSTTRPRRWREAADRVDERRLARAVGADEPDERARVDLEVDVDERLDPAVAHGDASGGEAAVMRAGAVPRRRRGDLRRRAGGAPERAAARRASSDRRPRRPVRVNMIVRISAMPATSSW